MRVVALLAFGCAQSFRLAREDSAGGYNHRVPVFDALASLCNRASLRRQASSRLSAVQSGVYVTREGIEKRSFIPDCRRIDPGMA
jgi:hypothetical protein